MLKAVGVVLVVVGLAGPVLAAGPEVVMQAVPDGPVPPVSRSADGRATGDGWVFYRVNGCVANYDSGLRQWLVMMHTREGRVFGAADATSGASFSSACATDANVAFYMTPANNSWTQFAIFPAATRSQ